MAERRRQKLDCVIVPEETAPAMRLVVATPTVTKDHHVLRMSHTAAPVARIAPGRRIRLETADCFSDQVHGARPTSAGAIDWDTVNPATGPVYVEGAEPGDVLAVRIERLEVADHGVMCTGGGWGVLGDRIDELDWRFLADRRRPGAVAGRSALARSAP